MRSFKLNLIVIALSACWLSACASVEKIDPYVQKLQWLNTADPQADARQAVKQNDLRLLGLATRSVNIPGIDADEMMQKARSYALQYNEIIKTHCQP
jgi:hypothetical protein